MLYIKPEVIYMQLINRKKTLKIRRIATIQRDELPADTDQAEGGTATEDSLQA